MLVKSKDIVSVLASVIERDSEDIGLKKGHALPSFIADAEKSLARAIGQLTNGREHLYYIWGNFNPVLLISYLIKQTRPAHVFMTSYSFSQKSIEQLQNKISKGDILSFKIILDNRVQVMSPKTFQMIASSFDYRCISVHAKVALLWNDT